MSHSMDKKPFRAHNEQESVIELNTNPHLKDASLPRRSYSDYDSDSHSIVDDDKTKVTVAPRRSQYDWWNRYHPMLRAFILIITVGGVLSIPAIVVGVLIWSKVKFFDGDITPASPYYTELTVVRWFTWATITWVAGVMVFHLVVSIPSFTVTMCKFLLGHCSERTKNRLETINSASIYTKFFLSSLISLLVFRIVFPQSSYLSGDWTKEGWTKGIFGAIACITIISAIMFVEKMVLQMIATSFHRTAYKERLKDLKYSLWVLDQLDDARRQHNDNTFVSPFAWARRNPDRSSTADLFQMGNRSRTNSNVNEGSKSSTTGLIQPFNFVAKAVRNAGKQVTNADVDINSNTRARRLAAKLFDALQGTRDYLTVRDFIPFFNTQKEAEKAFAMFDKDGNGDISRKEMRDRILNIYKERRALNSSLRDMSQIVGKLDKILIALAIVIAAILCSMVFGQNPGASLVSFGTLFVAWSFVFGGTLKNIFECLIFLFITHPYDAGDVVIINGTTMTVTKVRVLSTIFTRGDGQYVCAPNTTLLTLFINNLRRSPPQNETITVNFDFYTPEDKMIALKERLNHFIDQYPRIFLPEVGFSVDSILDANKLTVNLTLSYKTNWQNGGPRSEGRDKFIMTLRNSMMELGIKCYGLTQPVQLQGPPPRYDDLAGQLPSQPPGGGPSPHGEGQSRRDFFDGDDSSALYRNGSTMYDRAPAGGSSTGGRTGGTGYTQNANNTAAAATGLIAANMMGF
ncbi:hypothetical protein IWQ61_001985 [Dispira simplex]|nr:hypothetical protein IWQ61_001985 [Dispira simplex]